LRQKTGNVRQDRQSGTQGRKAWGAGKARQGLETSQASKARQGLETSQAGKVRNADREGQAGHNKEQRQVDMATRQVKQACKTGEACRQVG
jgi:hypothetical protein